MPASPVPLSLLSPFLLLPAQAHSQIGLPNHPCPSKQSFTVAGFYRGRKALLAYGSSGQSFQGPLSFQIPCPRAEGCFWKDRSRNPTGSKSSVTCQQYTQHLISLNPPHSLEVSIAIHIFQRKKPRIQEATEFVEHHSVGSGANIVEAGLPESTACALKPLLTPPSPCGGHGYSYLCPPFILVCSPLSVNVPTVSRIWSTKMCDPALLRSKVDPGTVTAASRSCPSPLSLCLSLSLPLSP